MEQSASQALVERALDQQDAEQSGGEHQSVTELEHSLLTLHANLSAATCRFLVLLRSFDERGGWHGWGMRWRRCRKSRRHSQTAASATRRRALSRGTRAITRVATPLNEGCLLNIALTGTAARLERVMAYARLRIAFENPDRLRALVNSACGV